MAETTLKVTNMKCEGCAKNVTAAVSGVSGVQDVKIDLPDKKVTIQFDNQQTNVDSLVKAIDEAGYHAE